MRKSKMRRLAAFALVLLLPAALAAPAGALTREEFLQKYPQPKIAPAVSVAAVEPGENWIRRGQPARLRVTAAHPSTDKGAEPIALGFEGGQWYQLLNFDVRDAAGLRQTWNFTPLSAGKTEGIVQIAPSTPASVDFGLDAAATQAIPLGEYQVEAWLSLGVQGKRVRSETRTITVSDNEKPASKPAEEAKAESDSEEEKPAETSEPEEEREVAMTEVTEYYDEVPPPPPPAEEAPAEAPQGSEVPGQILDILSQAGVDIPQMAGDDVPEMPDLSALDD